MLIIILIFVLQEVYSIDLLSKFHQTDYRIRNLRVEVEYVNHSLMHSLTMIGHKYNRTTTAFNVTFRSKVNLEDKLEMVIQDYKRASNEYRLFPLRYQVNICKVLNTNVIGLKSIGDYGNFPTCNWKKDTSYFAYNYLVDETHLPPLIPHGEYKTEAILLYVEDKLAIINVYGEIYSEEIRYYNNRG